MIELEQIKSTDKLGAIRPLINTALNEIQQDQPFVGVAVNPSVNVYNGNSLVLAVTASDLASTPIYLLCFPESDGVFVARAWGVRIPLHNDSSSTISANRAVIDIPGVKLPTREATIGTFVMPTHLGLDVSDNKEFPNSTGFLQGINYATTPVHSTIAEGGTDCHVSVYFAASRAALASGSTTYLSL